MLPRHPWGLHRRRVRAVPRARNPLRGPGRFPTAKAQGRGWGQSRQRCSKDPPLIPRIPPPHRPRRARPSPGLLATTGAQPLLSLVQPSPSRQGHLGPASWLPRAEPSLSLPRSNSSFSLCHEPLGSATELKVYPDPAAQSRLRPCSLPQRNLSCRPVQGAGPSPRVPCPHSSCCWPNTTGQSG